MHASDCVQKSQPHRVDSLPQSIKSTIKQWKFGFQTALSFPFYSLRIRTLPSSLISLPINISARTWRYAVMGLWTETEEAGKIWKLWWDCGMTNNSRVFKQLETLLELQDQTLAQGGMKNIPCFNISRVLPHQKQQILPLVAHPRLDLYHTVCCTGVACGSLISSYSCERSRDGPGIITVCKLGKKEIRSPSIPKILYSLWIY